MNLKKLQLLWFVKIYEHTQKKLHKFLQTRVVVSSLGS